MGEASRLEISEQLTGATLLPRVEMRNMFPLVLNGLEISSLARLNSLGFSPLPRDNAAAGSSGDQA